MTRKTNAQLLAENKKLTGKVKRLEKKAAEAENVLQILTQQHEKDVDDLAKERDEWKFNAEGVARNRDEKVRDYNKLKEAHDQLTDFHGKEVKRYYDKVADLELSEALARKEWDQWREKAGELDASLNAWVLKAEELKTACELKDKAILGLRLKVANQRNAINGLQRRLESRVVNIGVDQDKAAEFENTGGMTIGNGFKTLTTGTADWQTRHWKQKAEEWKRRALAAEQWQKTAEELRAQLNTSPRIVADSIISAAVHQAIGAASMCWENIDDAGGFLSNRAAEVAAALIRVIRGEAEELRAINAELSTTVETKNDMLGAYEWHLKQAEARIAELEAQIPPADLMAPAQIFDGVTQDVFGSPDEKPFAEEVIGGIVPQNSDTFGGPASEIGETVKAVTPAQTFEPGTVGYWLDKMDEPERSQALKNADLVLDSPARSTYSALNVFTRDKTPETGHYWLNIQRKYANKWKSQSTF